jgi:hypothetical protein
MRDALKHFCCRVLASSENRDTLEGEGTTPGLMNREPSNSGQPRGRVSSSRPQPETREERVFMTTQVIRSRP